MKVRWLTVTHEDAGVSERRTPGRRNFVTHALAVLATSLGASHLRGAAYAQQPVRPRRLGVLLMAFSPDSRETLEFRRALKDAGYAEGEGIVVEWREANANYDRLPVLAAELVRRQVDVIVVDGTPGALAAKRAPRVSPLS